jgi:2-polyprenyl-3-methyl-5-hydroxy-6-metoxy-1,4-benzoquinol methylase
MGFNSDFNNEYEDLERALGGGFPEWDKDANGVWVLKNSRFTKKDSISFPSSVYEDSDLDLESFWIHCRSKLIIDSLKKHNIETIWEIGAGDGRVSIPVSGAGINVIASEPHYSGARALAKHNVTALHASLADLKLENQSLSSVGMFDVLEHIEKVLEFLSEVHRVMKPGALLFLTVPAHQWLFSHHDRALGHFKRYTPKSLSSELRVSGFKALEVRHFFATLVMPAFLLRRIPYLLKKKGTHQDERDSVIHTEDPLMPHHLVNKALRLVLAIDSKMKLPFGLSLLGVFERA